MARMLIFIHTGTYPMSAVSANTLSHAQFRNIYNGTNAASPTEHGNSGVIEWHVATVAYQAAFKFEANLVVSNGVLVQCCTPPHTA